MTWFQGSIKEMLNLSQQEYVNRIDELNNQLISAWDQDQRVKALKIAIQVGVSDGSHTGEGNDFLCFT